jgi:hypothetical protein
MAITQNNLSYVGGGPSANNQVNSFQALTGAGAKSLDAFAQLKLDGAATTVTLNFIDGVQALGQSVVLPLASAAAASGGSTVYTTPAGPTFNMVGKSVLIAGFTNSANNGTFTISAVGSGNFTVNNASGVAELNPAATAVVSITSVPAAVIVQRTIAPTDTAATSTTVSQTGAFTSVGIPVTISAAGSNAQLLTVYSRIVFAS